MNNETQTESRVLATLEALGIGYELIQIDPAFADTAEFCQKYGFSMEDSGNTIVVASKRGPAKFCACVVKGSRRLDVNRTVKSLMGVSRASFASQEDTSQLTGMMIGGVTPFGLPSDLAVYIDPTLSESEYVILGSGSRSSKLKVDFTDLLKIPGAEVVEGLSIEPRPQD